MLKGINQWCYPEGTPLEKVFEYSSNAGFDAVELNVYEEDGLGLTLDTTIQEAELIAKQAEQHGLKLLSLSTALLWKAPLSSLDVTVREHGRKIVKKQLELASVMGIDTILVVPGLVNAETSYEVCYELSQNEIRKLSADAEIKEVNIGIENVWNHFLLSPLEMARYIDEINSDYVGAYFDVGNVLQFGYPEQWIRILKDRIRKVHVKDFSKKVGNITGFVPLLSGDVNWTSVMEALHEIGYHDVITAELTPYQISANELANDTARHMDIIFAKGTATQKV
ncbi:xylulose 5-phosphate 3-epimerase [Bacillus sp. HMSC76G11]|uniref:sugar phosphate isomerase/epimerase family protein n=1 Tax=Metabacillus idriensis TaxID=324768 RepID=UPI0008A8BCA2|nr:sugar phosphate isomerase/epimerase family protein [Metabacillus idriensis]OHR70668.1 xylulose 5-phosphate 3-epimerase [Bacillus sp. HMSC76G11]